MTDLVILGASAFPELGELIGDINAAGGALRVRAILDDDSSRLGSIVEGVPVTGGLSQVTEHADAKFVFAIGSQRTQLKRRAILDRLGLPPQRFATLVHPAAKVYGSARLGHGVVVHYGTVIGNGAWLDDFSLVLWNGVIGADNRLGEGCMLASHVTTNSKVAIGSYAFIGAGAVIGDALGVGIGALVGMGSVVLRDVEAGVSVLGNPARAIGRADLPPELAALAESRP